jgi:hypothetical protein
VAAIEGELLTLLEQWETLEQRAREAGR